MPFFPSDDRIGDDLGACSPQAEGLGHRQARHQAPRQAPCISDRIRDEHAGDECIRGDHRRCIGDAGKDIRRKSLDAELRGKPRLVGSEAGCRI